MLYKLRNNMLAFDPSPYLKPAQSSIVRVYLRRYITLDTNTKIYAKSFYPNTTRQWNSLPPMLHWHPHLTHSSVRCVSCKTQTKTMARAPANYWRVLGWVHRVLSTGDLRVLPRCVMSFVFLLVLLPPILISNSNLLPPFMLFYPCSFFFTAHACA